MKFDLLWKIVLISAVLFAPALTAFAVEDHPQIFRDAYFLEIHNKDLEGAAKAYESIVASGRAPATIVAEAKARLALCREELKARDLATLAPPESIAYLEIGSPGEHLENVARMLGIVGDPLEGIGGQNRPFPGEPNLVLPARIVISSEIFAQIRSFKGAALAITGFDPHSHAPPKGVLILHPGDAKVLRGLVETAAQFIKPAESIAGFPTVEFQDSGVHATIAFTSRLVVAGTDRSLVQGVIDRLQGNDTDSLARTDAFVQGTAARDDAMVYGFVNAQQAMKIVYRIAQKNQSMMQDLAVARAFLDLAHLNSVSLALGSSSQALQAEFVVSLADGQTNMVYNLIRTPPMRGRALKVVPANAAAVLALGINPESTESGGRQVQTQTQTIQAITGLDLGRELFANIREVACFVTVPDATGAGGSRRGAGPPIPDAGLAMVVGNADKSEALWDFLLSLPAKAMGNQDLVPDTMTIEGVQVRAYPLPELEGVKVFLARSQDTIIAGMTPKVIRECLLAQREGRGVLDDPGMKTATGQLGNDTSIALFGHLGRIAAVASMYAPPSEAPKLQMIGHAASRTVLTVLIDESPTKLRVAGNLSGLPEVGTIMDMLAEAGVLGGSDDSYVRHHNALEAH